MTAHIVCRVCWCGPCVCGPDEGGRPVEFDVAATIRVENAAPALLRACERAYRSTCATMGPASDLAKTLAEAIKEATGEYPPVPQVRGRFTS